nr:cobalamin biosynthesis protein [Nocardioides albus]
MLIGFGLDRLLGDPSRGHPVAGFGTLAAATERRLYADDRAAGAAYAATLVGGAVLAGVAVETVARRRPVVRMLTTAVATWAVLGGRSLEREADAVHARLATEDLPAARAQVGRLVGRDTDSLDASEVTRAVVESVAENTSDAVVAPLVWGAVAGVPGLLGYRAANTLDAMVGHHNDRYERFGWAAARLDDLANLPGSRLTGLLVLVMRPGRTRIAWRAWRRDAPSHPSPNAGVAEATFAAALDTRLGGTNTYYGTRVEHRAVMGDGPPPGPGHIPAATRLARHVDLGAALVAAAVAYAIREVEPGRSSSPGSDRTTLDVLP